MKFKKVPGWEQMLTAGAATYAIQLAGNALGFEIFGQLVLSLRDVNYVKHLVVTKMIRSLPYYKLVPAAEKLERDCKPKDLSRFVSHL